MCKDTLISEAEHREHGDHPVKHLIPLRMRRRGCHSISLRVLRNLRVQLCAESCQATLAWLIFLILGKNIMVRRKESCSLFLSAPQFNEIVLVVLLCFNWGGATILKIEFLLKNIKEAYSRS